MSTSKELEELGSKKAVLQAESRSLKEEQANLEERTRVLEEEIAIEQLKNDNRTSRDAISNLKSKVDELEQRLKETSRTPQTETTSQAQTEIFGPSQPKQEMTVGILDETTMEETEDETLTATPLENPMGTEPEKYSEDGKKQQEKKKRKFL